MSNKNMVRVHYGVGREVPQEVVDFAASLQGTVGERMRALKEKFSELDLAAIRGVIDHVYLEKTLKEKLTMTNLELVNFHKAYDILCSLQDKIEGLEEICEKLAGLTDVDGEYLLHQEPKIYTVQELFSINQQRLINSLLAVGIETSNDLISKTEIELLRMPNIGRLAIARIKDALKSKGLELKQP